MTTDVISPDLKAALKRLKLSPVLDTLPERLTVARQQKMAHQDLLLLVLSDEISRRDGRAAAVRADRGHLDPEMQLERWDETAKVTYDRSLWNELVSLRFVEANAHVAIVGPVGVGKTFLAHALAAQAPRGGPAPRRRLRPRRDGPDREPRHVRDPHRAPPRRVDHRHLEPQP